MPRTSKAVTAAAPAPAVPTADADAQRLLRLLEQRFEQHPQRHPGLRWSTVQRLLAARPEAIAVLQRMEHSGGEPDVVTLPDGPGGDAQGLGYADCAAESPVGRRSLCYDAAGLASRKEHKPQGNAVDHAAALGLQLLNEAQYHALQQLGPFDTKTSSWITTPEDLRARGGALFCDCRYGRVFTYHNGAESYYAARGYRGWLRLD